MHWWYRTRSYPLPAEKPHPTLSPKAPENLVDAPARFCTECGKTLMPGARFCGYCGKEVKNDACPKCGSKIEPGMRFCPACGTGLA